MGTFKLSGGPNEMLAGNLGWASIPSEGKVAILLVLGNISSDCLEAVSPSGEKYLY